MEMYKKFCKYCIQGKIGYKFNFHIIKDPSNNNNNNNNYNNNKKKTSEVSIVSPTQAAVDQAKSELREEKPINKL